MTATLISLAFKEGRGKAESEKLHGRFSNLTLPARTTTAARVAAAAAAAAVLQLLLFLFLEKLEPAGIEIVLLWFVSVLPQAS